MDAAQADLQFLQIAESQGSASVYGTVWLEDSEAEGNAKDPLAGITIQFVNGQDARETTTAADGKFMISAQTNRATRIRCSLKKV